MWKVKVIFHLLNKSRHENIRFSRAPRHIGIFFSGPQKSITNELSALGQGRILEGITFVQGKLYLSKSMRILLIIMATKMNICSNICCETLKRSLNVLCSCCYRKFEYTTIHFSASSLLRSRYSHSVCTTLSVKPRAT